MILRNTVVSLVLLGCCIPYLDSSDRDVPILWLTGQQWVNAMCLNSTAGFHGPPFENAGAHYENRVYDSLSNRRDEPCHGIHTTVRGAGAILGVLLFACDMVPLQALIDMDFIAVVHFPSSQSIVKKNKHLSDQ